MLGKQFDPGADYVRGSNVVGQMMIDTDTQARSHLHSEKPSPTRPLAKGTSSPYLTRHGTFYDQDMPMEYWSVGGQRMRDDELVNRWQNAPVQTFSSDSPLFSGQPEQHTDIWRGKPTAEVGDLADGHRNWSVESLRGQEEIVHKPWVLIGHNQRPYVVDGNHRVSAMRRRGSGDVQAHVLNVNEFPEIQWLRPNHPSRPSKEMRDD